MIFEELLQLHLDGTLSGADQAELFHILAVSDEKRQMFNEHTRLRAAINSDRAAGRVPAELSQRTLNAAIGQGRAIPVATTAARTSAGVLVSALVAAGLMLGGVVGYSIGTSQQQPSSLAMVSPVASAIPTTTAAAAALPSTGAEPHSAPVENVTERVYSSNATVSLPNANIREESKPFEKATTAPVVAVNSTEEKERTVQPAPATPPEKVVYVPQNGSREAFYTSRNDGLESPRNSADIVTHFEGDLTQGVHVVQNSLNTIGLPTQATFSLFRLRAGMKVSDNISAGVLVGQNLFALHYTEQVDPITQRTVSQFTTQIYTGAYAKYAFSPISGFTPLVTVGAAWSSYGPIGELELGLSRPVFNNVSIFAGLHSNMLFYQASGAWFNSQTASIMMGLGVSL